MPIGNGRSIRRTASCRSRKSRCAREAHGTLAGLITCSSTSQRAWDLDPFIVGVEIKVARSDLENDHKLSEYLPFVHTFFLAVPDEPAMLASAHDHTTKEIGILAVDLDALRVRVEKPPSSRGASHSSLVPETYRSLLLKNLAWNAE